MGYTLSVSTKCKEKSKKIVSILNDIIDNKNIYISNNPDEHGYSVILDNGIYASFTTSIKHSEHKFLWNVFMLIGKKYNTKAYYDDTELEIEDIKWAFEAMSNNIFEKLIFRILYKKKNKELKELKERFDKEIYNIL